MYVCKLMYVPAGGRGRTWDHGRRELRRVEGVRQDPGGTRQAGTALISGSATSPAVQVTPSCSEESRADPRGNRLTKHPTDKAGRPAFDEAVGYA